MGEDAVPDKKQNSAVWRRASARARARKGRALLIPIASTALLPAAFTFVVTIRYPNVARARALGPLAASSQPEKKERATAANARPGYTG